MFLSEIIIFLFQNIQFIGFVTLRRLFLGIGFLLRRDNIVKGVINLGFFIQAIFIAGVLLMLFDINVFNVGTRLEAFSIWFILISAILHVALVSAYFLNYKTKPGYQSLLYSLVILIGMFVIGTALPSEENVNYVFVFSFWNLGDALFLYIPLAFFLVVLPTHFFQVLMYRLWLSNLRQKNTKSFFRKFHKKRTNVKK